VKILVVGDLHLRAKKLKDIADAWGAVAGWAHKNSVDAIIQAGDVFDHANVYGREATTGTIYGAFISPFAFEPKPVPLYVVVGNHDMGSLRDKDALAPVDQYPWISVTRKPCVFEAKGNLSICAVPWVNRLHLISKLISAGMKLEDATKKVGSAIANMVGPLGDECRLHQERGRFVLFVGHVEVTGAKLANSMVQGDGSFEFSPDALRSIGADAYALAHIHVRQHILGLPNPNDGYLGCLSQLSFNEEGNSVGCRLIEIDGRSIRSDRWLENKSAPKYFTVASMDGLQYRAGTDYVKLRGNIRPDSLPEGVMFEPLPKLNPSRTRIAEKLDCDSPIETLIGTWHKIEACKAPLDAMIEEAKKLQRTCQVQDEAIGSLERIDRIRLKNITCHASTDIKLGRLGICGIAGPNGSGKTTAMESIILALYGSSPSRPVLPALMPKGDQVESAVELEFASGGRNYIARREFKRTAKTFAHKAYLFEKGKNEPLAGPKVEDVFAYSSRLVGDFDLVLSGVFSAQGDAANIVKLKPAARKDLFAKLLGTEKFISLSEAAKKLVAADSASVQACRSRVESLKIELAKEQDDLRELESLKAAIAKKEKENSEAVVEQKRAEDALAAIERRIGANAEASAKMEEIRGQQQRILAEGRSLKAKKIEAEKLDVAVFEASLASARREFSEAKEAFSRAEAAASEAARKKEEAAALRATAAEIRAEKAKAYSSYLAQKNSEIAAMLAQRQEQAQVLSDKASQIAAKLQSLTESLEQAERRSSLLKGFPDQPVCRACPLAMDGIKSRDSIPELQARTSKGAPILAAATNELREYREQTAIMAEQARASICQEAKHLPDKEEEAARLDESSKAMHAAAARMVQTGGDEKRRLQKANEKVEEIEKHLGNVISAKAELGKLDALIDGAKAKFKELEETLVKTVIPEAVDQSEHDEAKRKISTWHMCLQGITTETKSLSVELGRHQARMEQHAARKSEIARLDSEMANKGAKAEVYEALVKAFSRDGISQLIVDSTIPHLQNIMAQLMSECEGKWSIRIATQRETKAGGMQERIDILVDDGSDERDISTYSGGETNLLSAVVRIAFSILQAERSGKGLKVLVLDEAMFFADNENADAFMRMLRMLPKHFAQVFVISHSEFVLSSIQDKIFFSRRPDGASIVQTDFQPGAVA
jgi:DNA repair exonuclease SbcCD ATPase subunit